MASDRKGKHPPQKGHRQPSFMETVVEAVENCVPSWVRKSSQDAAETGGEEAGAGDTPDEPSVPPTPSTVWKPPPSRVHVPPKPAAKDLMPHLGQNSRRLLDGSWPREPSVPRIFFTPTALAKSSAYIRLAESDLEIGWLGHVEERPGHVFVVMDCYLFEQEDTVVECDLTVAGLSKFCFDLIKRGKKDVASSLRFWGHLHPGGSTTPSGQDETMAMEIGENAPYLIRAICSRTGRMEITFFDFKHRYRYNDVDWGVVTPTSRKFDEAIQAEIKAKVRRKVIPPPTYAGKYGGGYVPKMHRAFGTAPLTGQPPKPATAEPEEDEPYEEISVTPPTDNPDVTDGERADDTEEEFPDPFEATEQYFKDLEDKRGPGGGKP